MEMNKAEGLDENEAANLTYDLAEGHNVTLKGSMNEADLLSEALEHMPEELDSLFLSLMQRTEADHFD